MTMCKRGERGERLSKRKLRDENECEIEWWHCRDVVLVLVLVGVYKGNCNLSLLSELCLRLWCGNRISK